VEPTPQAVAEALREALSLPAEERRAMGARAATLTRIYSPQVIAETWDSVYRWLLRQGDKPDCILD
jgi:glycosyltransferase involved in cell wall biosynthesis